MLEVVTADAEGLAGSVASTKDLSERVSSKVRELDAAQVLRQSWLQSSRLLSYLALPVSQLDIGHYMCE